MRTYCCTWFNAVHRRAFVRNPRPVFQIQNSFPFKSEQWWVKQGDYTVTRSPTTAVFKVSANNSMSDGINVVACIIPSHRNSVTHEFLFVAHVRWLRKRLSFGISSLIKMPYDYMPLKKWKTVRWKSLFIWLTSWSKVQRIKASSHTHWSSNIL